MVMTDIRLSRNLFSTDVMDVKSFLFMPKIMKPESAFTASVNLSVILNCCLIIQYTGGNRSYNSDEVDFKSRMYTMTWKNRRITQRFFSSALEWFEDSKYSNMFFYTEDGELQINMDYSKTALVTDKSRYNDKSLAVRPTIVDDYLGRREGVLFSVNTSENTFNISWEDFIVLADIALTFDFEREALLLMQSFSTAHSLDRYTTPAEERMARKLNEGAHKVLRVNPFTPQK